MRISNWLVVITIILFFEIALVAGSQYSIHTITYGETLWSISRKYNIPYSKILACNPQIDPNNFEAGKTIRIPKSLYNTGYRNDSYIIKNGDTLWSIARKFSVSPEQIAKHNNITQNQPLKTGKKIRIPNKNSYIKQAKFQKSSNEYDNNYSYKDQATNSTNPFSWPVKGSLIENYGKNNNIFNGGIRIRSNQRQIFLAKKGRVIFAGIIRGYGLTIIINHGNGLVTAYSSKQIQAVVRVGSYLENGRVIAVCKQNYNNITMFFQVWQDNTLKDPRNYLK